MSETVISQAGPDLLPVPRRSSLKQVALAREILSADLTKDTWADIFKRAGYAEDTALSSAKDIRERPGVQRAIAAQTQAKRDSARNINLLTASKLRSRIEDDSASDQLILGAYKVTTDAIVAGADEVETVSESDRIDANNYIKAIVERILVATGIDPHTTSTQQLIDNALLTGPASDNGSYVNSASPPSTTLLLPEQGMTVDAVTVPCTPARRGPGRPGKQG